MENIVQNTANFVKQNKQSPYKNINNYFVSVNKKCFI